MRFPRWAYWASGGLIAVTAAVTAGVYTRLPAWMAVHWGVGGQADGFMPRAWAAWLVPLLMVALAGLLFGLVPLLEPWRHNLQRFRRAYAFFGVGLLLFLAGLQGWILAWNAGWQGDVRRFLALALAFLNGLMAWALPQARPNWYFGIRTPWTLSSPRVWHEVHRRARLAFALAAGMCGLAVLWPALLLLAAGVMVLVALGLSAYSWWLYRQYATRPLA